MKPKTSKQDEHVISLEIADDPEIETWLERFKIQYAMHSKLARQLEEVINVFQQGKKKKALEMLQAHDSLPELFMVCLEYVCRDPSLEAQENAFARHAKTKTNKLEVKSAYLEKKAANSKLTRQQFARDHHRKMKIEFSGKEKEVQVAIDDLDQLKRKLSETDSVVVRKQLRQEIKVKKVIVDTLKKTICKPYPERTIVDWITGLELLVE